MKPRRFCATCKLLGNDVVVEGRRLLSAVSARDPHDLEGGARRKTENVQVKDNESLADILSALRPAVLPR